MGLVVRARWTDLLVVSYRVEESHLTDLLPPGAEIYRLDGDAIVSLVGFRFGNVRVAGLPAPVPKEFPQWNFRTYIRSGGEWGVVFLKEYVPTRPIAMMVRALYGEPYYAAPLTAVAESHGDTRHVGYALRAEGSTHSIAVTADSEARPVEPGEPAAFHIGSGWGCRKSGGGQARFRVEHAPWRAYRVRSHSVAVDFEALYGARWGWLGFQEPVHVALLEGSDVKVGLPEKAS
jgi:uncharacterized protein YqjF (DUF2071 family)